MILPFYKLAYRLTYNKHGNFQQEKLKITKGKSDEDKPLAESAEYQIQWTETKTLCLSLGRARGKDQTETERFGGVGTHWPPEVVSEQGTPKEKTQRSPELPAEATGDKVERPEDEIICICSGSLAAAIRLRHGEPVRWEYDGTTLLMLRNA